ncbi:class I SAM-dependent methyltransferase [Lacticaseibacillus zeae]|uniref:Class I SAM-dependent methyltransferase n=1 Tax=Lacticaseibacillus zeae subsp. silagei TaxID=3068307 RepID=A0ABD7ZAD4_LACZE|nr:MULTISPECIES: class I SAM-dependent methyltransferase [Lacticaseibacillus]MDE3314331.1 class I SAM-dependent methyltransferase [Lacticaseibacillus zeae]OFS01265.1 methylase [Lactobacillus sp. HMSC068F07]WLV83962.1 class I SAM-dependent methyltransferase [Lacticaseibacillus sp. NCIMB 15475]WLV86718.1 class I SAM-dependent methyltransferase [Lacticaseibacillus sp. NCIMB 15474]
MKEDRAFWNQFAEDYAAAEETSRLPVARDVTAWLLDEGLLPTKSLVDLAAGTGRYAARFAAHVQQLTLIDWSSAMLAYARQQLTANSTTSVNFITADWHQLEARPAADLIFVSQLPTLEANELSLLTNWANQGVVLNFQTEQSDALMDRALTYLGQAVPVAYQADPTRVASYQQWLHAHQVPFKAHTLTYHLEEQTTISDLLPELTVPVGVKAASQLAKALTGNGNAHMPVTDHLTYTYTQLVWHSDH